MIVIHNSCSRHTPHYMPTHGDDHRHGSQQSERWPLSCRLADMSHIRGAARLILVLMSGMTGPNQDNLCVLRHPGGESSFLTLQVAVPKVRNQACLESDFRTHGSDCAMYQMQQKPRQRMSNSCKIVFLRTA